MSGHRFRLVLDGPGRGRVFLDDVEVHGVVAVDVRAAVDEANRVTLTLLAPRVEIEGDVEVSTLKSTSREWEHHGEPT